MSDDHLIEEYKEVCSFMRLHVTLRFTLITISIAVNGGLLKILADMGDNCALKIEPKLLGIFAPFFFWLLEERIADYYWHYRNRVQAIELNFNFRSHQDKVKANFLPDFLNSRSVARLFYISISTFWIISYFAF